MSGGKVELNGKVPSPIALFKAVKSVNNYYYYRFMALWILSGTTRVSRYQKGKTEPIWISWSKRQ